MQSQPLQILLIGGSGFVSGTLAKTAVHAGHRVWAVTRGVRPLPDGVIGIQVDRQDRERFAQAIARIDIPWDLVVDSIGYEAEDAQQDIAVFRHRAKHFIFISTDFVFDPARRRFPQNEDDAVYLTTGYGGRKRRCELEFLNNDTDAMAWTILRPSHIYGPGSLLGCLPGHSRDPELIGRLQAQEPLKLIGGGHFLQHPVFAPDLAKLILSCASNPKTHGQIYQVAGPDIIESWVYYAEIAAILGTALEIEEIPSRQYLAQHPEMESFACHRFYDLTRLRDNGLDLPSTPLKAGLRQHVMSLLQHTKKI